MIIRQGRLEDAETLLVLLEQLGHPLSKDEVFSKIQAFMAPGYQLLVCEVEHEVSGFISLHWFDKFHSAALTGRITALCVRDDARGTGIGGALLSAAAKLLSENGCHEIEVTTNRRRELTPDFYRKHGYEERSLHFIRSL